MVVAGARKRSRLLLVDGAKSQLDVWCRECRRDGAVPFTAGSADEAISIARREKPAIAIVELFLPNAEDCPRLIGQLKKIDPTIVVFVVSGYMTVMRAVDCVKAGADDCFQKPVSCSELLQRAESGSRLEANTHHIPTLEDVEREHVMRVLGSMGGNVTRAADALGIKRNSLQRKLKDYSAGALLLGPIGRRRRALRLGPKRLHALNNAQVLINEAFSTTSREMRRELAEQALEISSHCADALVLLAEVEDDLEAATSLLDKALDLGLRLLGGPKAFAIYNGEFWTVPQTRPYMRARFALGKRLWKAGRHEAAIEHFHELLRLNPPDHQGVRYVLAGCLLYVGRRGELADLASEHGDDLAGVALQRIAGPSQG